MQQTDWWESNVGDSKGNSQSAPKQPNQSEWIDGPSANQRPQQQSTWDEKEKSISVWGEVDVKTKQQSAWGEVDGRAKQQSIWEEASSVQATPKEKSQSVWGDAAPEQKQRNKSDWSNVVSVDATETQKNVAFPISKSGLTSAAQIHSEDSASKMTEVRRSKQVHPNDVL